MKRNVITLVLMQFLFSLIFGDSAQAGIAGTWNVKLIGQAYSYSSSELVDIVKNETITLEVNGNQVSVAITDNGTVNTDGSFSGYGGNSSFGAKDLQQIIQT